MHPSLACRPSSGQFVPVINPTRLTSVVVPSLIKNCSGFKTTLNPSALQDRYLPRCLGNRIYHVGLTVGSVLCTRHPLPNQKLNQVNLLIIGWFSAMLLTSLKALCLA